LKNARHEQHGKHLDQPPPAYTPVSHGKKMDEMPGEFWMLPQIWKQRTSTNKKNLTSERYKFFWSKLHGPDETHIQYFTFPIFFKLNNRYKLIKNLKVVCQQPLNAGTPDQEHSLSAITVRHNCKLGENVVKLA